MKYKVGDKVKIVEKKERGGWNIEGKMDKWLGKTMTIIACHGWGYSMQEDQNEWWGGWSWNDDMIAGLAPEECNNKIVITTDGTTTTARLYDGKKVVKSASAKCSSDDTFNFEIGARIAFDRLTNCVNEVKRPAKVGEYIKIVDAFLNCKGSYNNGEIFKVTEVSKNNNCCYFYIPNGHTCWKNNWGFAYAEEYVVLEGYKESDNNKFEKGDTVKIIGKKGKIKHHFKKGDIVEIKMVDGKDLLCRSKRGLAQWVSMCDVEIYK